MVFGPSQSCGCIFERGLSCQEDVGTTELPPSLGTGLCHLCRLWAVGLVLSHQLPGSARPRVRDRHVPAVPTLCEPGSDGHSQFPWSQGEGFRAGTQATCLVPHVVS